MSQAEFEQLLDKHADCHEAYMTLWRSMVGAARGTATFSSADLRKCEESIARKREELHSAESELDSDTVIRAQALHDKRLMERHGLLFDDEMIADINTVIGNMMLSRPTLIVGDKGIAKTQLAKFAMSLYGNNPIVVSVRGDMMSDELIGQVKHDKEQETFRFYEGAVPQAMRAGMPVLLDEINFGDQAIVARLQDILLKKPRQTAFIQEEAEEITVSPGFTILATANEASARYRHREILDPAIRDRFEILERSYPDLNCNPLTDELPTLMRLARASEVNDDGSLSDHIDSPMLEALVRVSAITQHLYAVSAKEAVIRFDEGQISSVVRENTEPILTDCITPRALCRAVEDSAGGNLPGRTLNRHLIAKLIRSLDQAGSKHNWEHVKQAAELAGLEIDD